jgi:RHS repeat-associated protein
MGYLGAQERRADPMSGLIQMGARSYDPQLGAFLSEDVVYGAVGIGTSLDRYAYAWGNPVNLYDLDGRFPSPSDIGDAVTGTADDAIDTAEDFIDAGGEQVSIAQEYWVNSDSWIAPFAGSAVSIVDLAINPDRLDYYLKSNNLPQKQQLADCYNGGHPARTIGGIAGATGGFVLGASSAAGDLGARSVGVGLVSGGAGATIGGTLGTLGGCAFGVIRGLVH